MKYFKVIAAVLGLTALGFASTAYANVEQVCNQLPEDPDTRSVFLFDNQQQNSTLSLGDYLQGVLEFGGYSGSYTVADLAQPLTVVQRGSGTDVQAPLTTAEVLGAKPLAVYYLPQTTSAETGICGNVEVHHRVYEDTMPGTGLSSYVVALIKNYYSPANGCYYINDYWAQMADPALTLDQRRDLVSDFVYGNATTPGQFVYEDQLFDSLLTSDRSGTTFDTEFVLTRTIQNDSAGTLTMAFEFLNAPPSQEGAWSLANRTYDIGQGPSDGDFIFGSAEPFTYNFALTNSPFDIIRFGINASLNSSDAEIVALIQTIFNSFRSGVPSSFSRLVDSYCGQTPPWKIPGPDPTPSFTGIEPTANIIRSRNNLNSRPHFTLTGPNASSVSAAQATPFLGVPTINGVHLGVAMAAPFVADGESGLLMSSMSFEEWDYMDNWHKDESVSGMVLPLGLGLQTEADGTEWEVGKIELDPDTAPGKSAVVSFSSAFSSTPYIFTTVHHYGRDCETVNPRLSNIGAAQFTLHYENQSPTGTVPSSNRNKSSCTSAGANRGPNGGVEISYFAIAPGAQTSGSGTLASPATASVTLDSITRSLELFSRSMGVNAGSNPSVVEWRDQAFNMPAWNTRFFMTQADSSINSSSFRQSPRDFRYNMAFSGTHNFDQTVAFMRILPVGGETTKHVYSTVQTYNGGASGGALYMRRRDI